MKVLIIGLGEVGRSLCESLSERDLDVVGIDKNESITKEIDETLDVRVIQGDGARAQVLSAADVGESDFFLAMTQDDHTNLIACKLAKALGAKATIARIHDSTYMDNSLVNYQLHFNIDLLVNPEALSAIELASRIRNPGRIAVEKFSQGQIELQQITIEENSKLASKAFRVIDWSEDVRPILIESEGKMRTLNENTVLYPNSRLTLVGNPETLLKIRQKFNPGGRSETVRIILFGASETSIGLIKLLKNPRFKVRLIEPKAALCRQIAESFPHVTVIEGSASSLRVLQEEQVENADYFVACSRNDELNVMTCLQARQLGAKHVQLVFNRSDYQEVLEVFKNTLDIGLAITPSEATVTEVMHHISSKPYTCLASLPKSKLDIVEIQISKKSPVAQKKFKDIQLPKEAFIAAILHKFQAKIPKPEDALLPGDRVIALVAESNRKMLVKAIA